jgi:hypothetical protein
MAIVTPLFLERGEASRTPLCTGILAGLPSSVSVHSDARHGDRRRLRRRSRVSDARLYHNIKHHANFAQTVPGRSSGGRGRGVPRRHHGSLGLWTPPATGKPLRPRQDHCARTPPAPPMSNEGSDPWGVTWPPEPWPQKNSCAILTGFSAGNGGGTRDSST